jgi:phosphatidylglycerophosphate synthase
MKYSKKVLFFLLILGLSYLTTYFSMYEYSKESSSSCFDCSYQRDVFIFSLFSSIALMIIFILLKRFLKKEMVIFFFIVIYLVIIFFNNYNIFIDRVSSWSSFSLKGELIGVFSNSYLYLIVGSSVVLVFTKFLKV